MGIKAERRLLSPADRIEWLRGMVRYRRVIIEVAAFWWLPIYTHTVVVVAYEGRNYYVMDDRKFVGKFSRNPNLPAGNAVWSEEELLAMWRHLPIWSYTPWSKRVAVVYLK